MATGLIVAACSGGGAAPADDTVAAPAGGAERNDPTPDDLAPARSAAPDSVPEPARGGTLRIGVEAESDGLNPAANNFAVSGYLMAFPIFDPLIAFDADGDWFPYLAESATPNDDATSWELRVRDGVRFHDGEPLDAAAVVANFDAAINDPILSLALAPLFDPDSPIEIVDDLTVRYNLTAPNTLFPVGLVGQLGMMASPAWLAAAAGDESRNQAPVGTGPFRIAEREQDRFTRVVRNDDYWRGTDDIRLDAIEFRVNTDMALAAAQLLVGDLDVIVTSDPEAILTVRGQDGVTVDEDLRSDEDFIMVNASAPPFDDLRARQALAFAADRDGYLALVNQGVGAPADSMFHPDQIWNNPEVVQEANQPDRAAPLVASYCADVPTRCRDGRIVMSFQYFGPSTVQTRTVEVFSAGWEPYFVVDAQQYPQDQLITRVATGQWQAALWRQFGSVDPENDSLWLECSMAEGLIAINWPRHCTEERDALLFAQRATFDPDERVRIWQEIQTLVRDSYTYIFLDHTNWAVAARDEVRGLHDQTGPGGVPLWFNSQGRGFYHNAWLAPG